MRILALALLWLIFCCSSALAWSHGTGVPPTYYVNASTGSDSNAGTIAAPWQTLHKINTAVFAQIGTTINLQGSFSGGDNGLSITTANAPNGYLTLQSYGAGATISSGNSTACVTVTNVDAVNIKNLTCVGGGNSTNTTNGILYINTLGNGTTTAYQGAGGAISGNTISGYGSSGIRVLANLLGWANVPITGNTVHDSTGSNAVGNFVSCIHIDYGPSYGSHKATYNVTISQNITYNCNGNLGSTIWSGSGIFVGGVVVGLVHGNVAYNFGGNNLNGGDTPGIWGGDIDTIVFQYNEAFNGGGSGPNAADCFDLDGGTFNSIMQYNYGHDCAGGGMLAISYADAFVNNFDNNIIRYNIIEHSGKPPMYLAADAPLTNLFIYNNVFYDNSGTGAVNDVNSNQTWTGFVKNNLLIASSSPATVLKIDHPGGGLVVDYNYYSGTNWEYNGGSYNSFASYQTGSSQDAHSTTTSVVLNGVAGSGGTCYPNPQPPCPTNYELRTSSTAQLGTGVSISSPGAVDYYGNSIPNGVGGGWNMGAYGGSGVP